MKKSNESNETEYEKKPSILKETNSQNSKTKYLNRLLENDDPNRHDL